MIDIWIYVTIWGVASLSSAAMFIIASKLSARYGWSKEK